MNIFDENIMNALGWSFVHTLWQGIIVGTVLFVALRFLRNKSSNIRYMISVSSLLLIVFLSIFNFSNNYNQKSEINNEVVVENVHEAKFNELDFANTNSDFVLKADLLSALESNIQNLDKYFPIIINLWILGILLFTAKFIYSFLYTNKLKRSKVNNIDSKWIIQFEQIRKKLKLNKKIKYIESKMVKVPFVLGYLKPIIVIPFGMLTSIPANQVEAIIAHELAHIRRNDYIINVLQTIIETVFFFHPAVWYISAQIRKERENCCDDIALGICEEKLTYAKALVSVQELQLGKFYSAVAFSGKKKHLLNRIKRMIMKPKVKSNFTDKIIAALIIVSAIVALSFTYAAETTDHEMALSTPLGIEEPQIKPNKPLKPAKEVLEPIKEVKKDTTHKHHYKTIDIDGQTITKTSRKKGKESELKFTMKNGKAIDLYVNGKKVDEKDYPKYQKEIDKTIADLEDAKEEIRDSMKDIEDLDIEKIKAEVAEAVMDIDIDMEQIMRDVEKSMKEVEMVNIEEILKEVEESMIHLEEMDIDFDFDFDESHVNVDMEAIMKEIEEARIHMRENIDMDAIRKELEDAKKDMENIDMEEIKRQMDEAHKQLSEIDMQKMQKEIQESMKEVEKIDKEKIKKELQESLDEIENLELEEK